MSLSFIFAWCAFISNTIGAMEQIPVFNPTRVQVIPSPDTKWDFHSVQFSPVNNDLLATEVNAKVVFIQQKQPFGWRITDTLKNKTTRAIFDLAFSRDGAYLVAPVWGGVEIFEKKQEKKQNDESWHWAHTYTDNVSGGWDFNCARFNHRGNLLAHGTGYGGILLYRYTKHGLDKNQFWSYTNESCKNAHAPKAIPHIAFNLDDSILASSGRDATVKTWEQPPKIKSNASWACTKTLKGDGGFPLVFLGQNRLITSDEKGILHVYLKKNDTWEMIQELKTHKNYLTGLVAPRVLPHGPDLISSSWDQTIQFWQLVNGTLHCMKTLLVNQAIWGIDVSPNGTTLAATLSNKTLELWNLFIYAEKKRGRIE